MTIRLLVAFVALLLSAPVAFPRDLIVDNLRGSDSQNDRGLLSDRPSFGPYRTINRALLAAQPGDRIIITNTGQPYRECISLVGTQHSGSLEYPFEIIGNGATLDGSISLTLGDWENLQGDLWALRNTPPGHGLLTSKGELVNFKPMSAGVSLTNLTEKSWTRIGPHMYFRGTSSLGPFDLPLEVSHQTTGITLYDVENVIIRDLIVTGYRIDGINAHDRADNVRLANITCTLNGRSGVTVAGASRVGISESRLELNGLAQLRTEGLGVAYIRALTMSDTLGKKSSSADRSAIVQQ